MARLMALDVGEARIGVAVGDSTGFLASPYTTLHVFQNEEQTWAAIQRLIDEIGAEGIVVGLPISMDGQIRTQGAWVQAFAERLKSHISLPLTFWDERLSTVEAERLLAQRNQEYGDSSRGRERGHRRAVRRHTQTRRRQRGQEIDALAATVILQDYLDHLGRKTEEQL